METLGRYSVSHALSKITWDWMLICYFRDCCHSRMSLCILPAKSGGCWMLLRSICTGVWCWKIMATWCPWVSAAALSSAVCAAWLLKPGGVGVAFVKYLGILDLCLEARFSLCLFGIRIRQLNDHYFAKYQRGALWCCLWTEPSSFFRAPEF